MYLSKLLIKSWESKTGIKTWKIQKMVGEWTTNPIFPRSKGFQIRVSQIKKIENLNPSLLLPVHLSILLPGSSNFSIVNSGLLNVDSTLWSKV